jgi:hypothetical protein
MSTGPGVSGLRRRGALRHGSPDEADEFASERRHRDRRAFTAPDEMAVAAMQALLRAPGLRAARGRLSVRAGRERHAASTSTRRACVLPALVMAPRRWVSPEEYSLGTRPR